MGSATKQASRAAPAAATRRELAFGKAVGVVCRCSRLEATAGPPFAHLTFPRYRPLLDELVGAVAVAAWVDGVPAGLALARNPDPEEAELLSVAVARPWRRRGIARRLLAELERQLGAAGCRRIRGTYRTGTGSTAAVERLLAGGGWSPPVDRILFCKAACWTMERAGWLDGLRVPEPYRVFAWQDLTLAHRQAIEGAGAPPGLSPFFDEERIEYANSLGVEREGEVVGWMITHRLGEESVRYSRLWVRPEVRRKAVAPGLVAESIKRHLNGELRRSRPYGIWDTALDNEAMLRFVRRRLAPFCLSVELSRASEHRLGDPE